MTFSSHANALRILAADMIEHAHSGHPGAPLGMAEMASVLWRDVLRFNPLNAHWMNRDRFILSNGHASALLYALLHLSGFDLSLDDLKHFRQQGSKTPGHPEFKQTAGVETSTGPLGQGFANAVGIALAERLLSAEFNRESFPLIDFHTYVFLGDGCLMEGIVSEAASLAGTWQLNKLIALWDDNGISIDGPTQGWFSENVVERFKAQGWNVIANVDGHNTLALSAALKKAKEEKNRPTFIQCKTTIGAGSGQKAGTAAVHGAPLGKEAMQTLRQNLNWPHAPFEIPAEVYAAWDAKEKGQALEAEWQNLWRAYQKSYPAQAKRFEQHCKGALPEHWDNLKMQVWASASTQALSTRLASQKVLEKLVPNIANLVVGSADLSPSNLTQTTHAHDFSAQHSGNYVHYGVREFAMTAIANGLSLCGFLPVTATFLIFSDYAKNAIRMAALMQLPHVMVYTHDSIGVGEDGPTHQPIEQLAQLRLIPNMDVWRPADYFETAAAWFAAIENQRPTALALSRQNLPVLTQGITQETMARGAYVLKENPAAEITLIATGSELSLAMDAALTLQTQHNIPTRVVSMPSSTVFDRQDADFQQRILGEVPRLFIEAAHPDFWWKYLHQATGDVLGINHFGASAKAQDLLQSFGFSVENVVQKVKKILG